MQHNPSLSSSTTIRPRIFPAFSIQKRLPKPFGFNPTSSPTATPEKSKKTPKQQTGEQKRQIYRSALRTANESFSQTVMSGVVMMFFMGNSLHIFTILMLLMFVSKPVQAIYNTMKVFRKYSNSDVSVVIPIVLYICYNMISLGLALYKAYKMNLIPTEWLYHDPYLYS